MTEILLVNSKTRINNQRHVTSIWCPPQERFLFFKKQLRYIMFTYGLYISCGKEDTYFITPPLV